MIEVLIDDKLEKCDVEGYVYGFDITKRFARFSFIQLIADWYFTKEENFWVVGSGHVFIFNYNPETINPKLPKTFKQYKLKEQQK